MKDSRTRGFHLTWSLKSGHQLNDPNVQKPSEIPHIGVFLDFSAEWSKQGWLNCSGEIVGQSRTKIQPCLQRGVRHPQGHILSIFCLSLHWGEPSPMLRLSWSHSMGKTEWLHQKTPKRETQFMHFSWLRKTCLFCTTYCDTQKSLPRKWKQSLFWEYTEISSFLLVRSTKLFHYNSERMGC